MSVDEVIDTISPWVKKKPHSISITGGEPLLQVDALKTLIPKLTLPLYLETNGILHKHLEEVKDMFDYYAVDYKPGYDKEFTDFVSLIKDKKGLFIKYVVIKDFPILDIQKMSKIISALNPNIPLILQPVTPFAGIKEKASPKDIERAFTCAKTYLSDVRIIPQTHKLMGLK